MDDVRCAPLSCRRRFYPLHYSPLWLSRLSPHAFEQSIDHPPCNRDDPLPLTVHIPTHPPPTLAHFRSSPIETHLIWLYYHVYVGNKASVIHKAHSRYRPPVRVAPHEIDTSDADELGQYMLRKEGLRRQISMDMNRFSQQSMLTPGHQEPRLLCLCFLQ